MYILLSFERDMGVIYDHIQISQDKELVVLGILVNVFFKVFRVMETKDGLSLLDQKMGMLTI